MSNPFSRALIACVAASIGGLSCNLLPYFQNPPGRCPPGVVEQRTCGACREGLRVFVCREDQQWVAGGSCEGNPFDVDGDGFANAECYLAGRACCGEPDCDDTCAQCFPGGAEISGNTMDEDCSGAANDMDGDGQDHTALGGHDCDDHDPLRWLGHADLDGDGFDAVSCGGIDCDDNDPLRWSDHADLDGDGFDTVSCGGRDCDDHDPLRWLGHADLDGDGHDALSCGGDDCDDSDPLRWIGHTDLDGDGHNAEACGGDDCNDDDPLRWLGHADLDGDGVDDARCGGQDCDDDCSECFPGGFARCIGSRDHDCNGEVDELTGCLPATPVRLCLRDVIDVGEARDVFVSGPPGRIVAYVASRDGVYAVEVGDRNFGTIRGWLDTSDSWAVFVEREIAFVAGSQGLFIADFRRPDRPVLRAGPVATGDSRGVFVSRAQAFVASVLGLVVVDAHNRDDPAIVGSLGGLAEDSRDVFVSQGLAFVASDTPVSADLGFYVADVSLPAEPSRRAGPFPWLASEGVFLASGELYLASQWGLLMCDVTAPEAPQCDTVVFDIPARDVFVADDYAYVAGDQGLWVLDVSTPQDAEMIHGPVDIGPSEAVFVSWELVFVAGQSGLQILSMADGGCS